MIKKKLFKYASVLLCASMMAMSLAACGTGTSSIPADNSTAIVSQNGDSTLEKVLNDTLFKSEYTDASATENKKEETVYVFADASGKQSKLIINERLKNASKAVTINDTTMLKNISNINGNEPFTVSGNQVTWNADGNDITYQGDTNETTPVTMQVKYYLNDKEISPDALAGKSGRVTIRFDYTNHLKKSIVVNGTQKDAYVPFTMVTGMILPSDKFSNIKVTNGKLIESSKGNIVVGAAMPGLKESLNISFDGKAADFDIPEYFEVTADVNDFELDMTMSVAASNLFTDMNFDDLSSDEITDKMDTLTDAGDQLEDGSKQLADGMSTLYDKVPQLKEGVAALNDGAGQLKDGTDKLDNGAQSLVDGAAQLDGGASSLEDGASALDTGAGSLQTGLSTYTAGVASAADGGDQLVDGAGQLLAGINAYSDSMRTQIVTGIAQLSAGAGSLSAGIDQLGMALTDAFSQIKTNAAAYGAKYNEAITQAASIETLASTNLGSGSVNDNLKAVAQLIKAQTEKDVTFADITPQTDLTNDITNTEYVTGLIEKYMNSYASAVGYNDMLGSLNAAVNQASGGAVVSVSDAYMKEMQLLVSAVGTGSVYTALNQVYSSAENENMSLSASLNELSAGGKAVSDGANQLKAGIGTFDGLTPETVQAMCTDTLCSALFKLQAGAQQLSGGTTELRSGLAQLKANNEKLNQGAMDLKNGSNQLAMGTKTLKAGISSLAAGANTLKEGTSQLTTGANDLKNGTQELSSASDTLADGVGELNEGAITLKDGMIEFNTTGLKKIADLVNNDVDGAIDNIKKIMELGNDYQSFAGKSENMEGSVKFIYKTEGITK